MTNHRVLLFISLLAMLKKSGKQLQGQLQLLEAGNTFSRTAEEISG